LLKEHEEETELQSLGLRETRRKRERESATATHTFGFFSDIDNLFAADQSFNLRGPTLHSYEKSKIFPPVWRLDEILWSNPFAILQVAAAI
jgi:hypothetical protein